ncbi:hypothetical protein BJY52DRAFT_1253191 [Lactarius psammicola]|nr:hypothetical protein BJY52DRAFT_1253191 [Lactarius psammicola]
MLNTMTMRHEPMLKGVVLAHSNVHFLNHVARLQGDSPFTICHVRFEVLVWSPQRGMSLLALDGRVSLLPGPRIITRTPHIQRFHPTAPHPH